jgi:hypothetical protein
MFTGGAVNLADLCVGAALLGYAVAQYRLQGIVGHALPPNVRPGRKTAESAVYRRPLERVGLVELAGLLLVLIGAPAAAVLLLAWISQTSPPFGMADRLWRPMLLLWLIGLTAFLASVVLRVVGWLQASPEAHELYLQDVLWQETRREQTRLNRWLTWARLKGQRRKEQS